MHPHTHPETTAAAARAVYPRIGLFIDGEWIHDRSAWSAVRNPSDEASLGPVTRATGNDLTRALHAAERGFRAWRDTAPQQRVRVLHRATAMMRERVDTIAQIITLEHGKPIALARAAVDFAISLMARARPRSSSGLARRECRARRASVNPLCVTSRAWSSICRASPGLTSHNACTASN